MGIALAEENSPCCLAGQGAEHRGAELVGDLRQLIGSDAGRTEVLGGQHDLDKRTQQLGPGHRDVRFVRHPADRHRRCVDLALGQAKHRQARLRFSSPLAGLPIRLFGVGELAAEPVHLGLLVERHPHRRSASKPLASPIRLVRRLRPCAVKQHDLGSMHPTLAAVRHQSGL